MSTASQDVRESRVSRITERVTLIATEPRASLGWALADLGNGIARLGRKLEESVPTVDDGLDWFVWGQEEGSKLAARNSLDMMQLAFEAGQRTATKAVS